ncbi:hypothetical protein EDD21DRAFT_227830 [Dissophora ornata]|nr:hypothetical protein EDD21DRAFT_227830 [Dissophora ornata]
MHRSHSIVAQSACFFACQIVFVVHTRASTLGARHHFFSLMTCKQRSKGGRGRNRAHKEVVLDKSSDIHLMQPCDSTLDPHLFFNPLPFCCVFSCLQLLALVCFPEDMTSGV